MRGQTVPLFMVLGVYVDYSLYSAILSPMKINRVLSVSYYVLYYTLKHTRNQVETTHYYSSHQTSPSSFPYCRTQTPSLQQPNFLTPPANHQPIPPEILQQPTEAKMARDGDSGSG
jgi:hypothetical protein